MNRGVRDNSPHFIWRDYPWKPY